jgi:hypothetical protein
MKDITKVTRGEEVYSKVLNTWAVVDVINYEEDKVLLDILNERPGSRPRGEYWQFFEDLITKQDF